MKNLSKSYERCFRLSSQNSGHRFYEVRVRRFELNQHQKVAGVNLASLQLIL